VSPAFPVTQLCGRHFWAPACPRTGFGGARAAAFYDPRHRRLSEGETKLDGRGG
jgi:hypothetical protein